LTLALEYLNFFIYFKTY